MFADFARASDAPSCHDMPARQSVLDQGKEYLRTQSEVETNRSYRWSAEIMGLADRASHVQSLDLTTIPTAESLEQIPLDTIQRKQQALYHAQMLEDQQLASLANILYTRLTKELGSGETSGELQALIFEGAGRTKIILNSKISQAEELTALRDWGIFSRYYSYFDGSSVSRSPGRYVVPNAVQKATLDATDLQLVESLYKSALEIRRKSNFAKENLISDLLVLGALNEIKNKPTESYSYYMEAREIDHSSSLVLSKLLRRNPSILKYVEGNLMTVLGNDSDSSDGALLSALNSNLCRGKTSQ